MRAAADVEASVTRDGVTVHDARYGYASPTLVIAPGVPFAPPAPERVVVLQRFDEVVE